MKNAQKHRSIDAQGEAEGIKPLTCGILYSLPRSVYYFSSYFLPKVTLLLRLPGGKIYFLPGYEEKIFPAVNCKKKKLLPAGIELGSPR